ncbi:MAG: ParB/RepB/Spo0J family partition protein [Bacilli bacterium]|nr:ParB/RepB/Spo0J family partition protein [Bacilli bacterium]
MNNYKKIKLKDIDSFKNHPYKVENDDSIKELANSIKENGLINPLIVRQKENGRYELISGHRRKLALELNGEKDVEVNIKELTDDEATIFMVDSNMQREKVLPSEKAYAYKMKYDALKHQGKKTSGPEVQKLDEDSDRNIRRYVRLTYLIPELLELVDNTVKFDGRTTLTMGIKPAVEISYLSKDNQRLLYEAIDYNQATPSHAQSIKIRNMEKNNKLNEDVLDSILTEEKGNQRDQIAFNKDKLVSVLPPELLKRDKRYVEQYIVDAISFYSKSKNIERGDAYDLDV